MRELMLALVVATAGALVVPRALPSTRSVAVRPQLEMKIFDWKRRETDESHLIRADSQEFRVTNIHGAPGSKHRKKRKGRGIAAGQGASCGFGMRGQKSRAGRPARPGFEGGQTPLYRRLPKLAGRPPGPGHNYEIFNLIKLEQLQQVEANSEVDFKTLLDAGIATKAKKKGKKRIFKVVGSKDDVVLPTGLTVYAHSFTKSAKEAIDSAGGKTVYLSKTTHKPLEVDA